MPSPNDFVIGATDEGGGYSGNPPRRFNTRVTVYTRVTTSDGKGGVSETWDVAHIVRANTRRFTLNEEARAGQMGLNASWLVTVRLNSCTTDWLPRRTRLVFTDQLGAHTLMVERLVPQNLRPGGFSQATVAATCSEVFTP